MSAAPITRPPGGPALEGPQTPIRPHGGRRRQIARAAGTPTARRSQGRGCGRPAPEGPKQ